MSQDQTLSENAYIYKASLLGGNFVNCFIPSTRPYIYHLPQPNYLIHNAFQGRKVRR